MEDYRLEQTGQEVQRILNGAAMDANLQAEVERATEAEGRLQGNIDAEEQARQDADSLLQQGIDEEAQRAKDAEEANAGEIEGIKALIPSTATPANKLADTNYVNSSIQTATAEYRGDYNVVTDLHLAIDATHAQIETLLPTVIAEADKNDYCYVMIPTSAQTPTEIAKIERYKMTSEGWKFEYDVNNSTFTAEEWAAIKSGITSGLVGKLNALPTNADLLLLLAGKQDVLTFDSVPVPESNNPVKSGGVYSAIDDEKTARLNSDTAIHTELDGLQAKVPATASSDNKLVDQNQMNTSISTATATYRGDWNVVSDLHLAVDATRAQIAALLPTVISTADNNDYCYVEIPTSAETPTQIERVERFKYNGTAWAYEYVLNNSGFTAAQWAAINSMITSGLVAKLSALPTNADLLAMLAQKQDNLTFDSTPTENSTNPVTSGGVFAADKALSDAIEAILLLIPSAASALNKLVDTSLMNSSISTATATFRGTYNLVSDLGLGIDATEGQIAAALSTAISTADNNDYAFVQIPTSAQTPTQIARTDRYKFNGTAWGFEYTLNTSGFTAAQWAAINSTITSALVAKLNALPTAAELQEALGTLTSGITAINQKIPSAASQANKLVDNASMESYIAQVINILDASFNVTSTDGHITLHITQVDGVITSVEVQSTDIASAADLALKASQADLTALASRVTTAEGNITSLTGRMGTAETNIANLQQLYNNLQQSKPVPVTALPETGQQQGVIYRLTGTTSYSDYMWNGSSWVLMATYNNAIDPRPKKASQNLVTSGGVFDNIGALDVSELNATENPHTLAQYADLSAALAAIPTDYQKGGMSIKFVQTSDNKYVQYFCNSNSFTTNILYWEKINLEKEVNQIDFNLGGNLATPIQMEKGYIACGGYAGTVVNLTPIIQYNYTHAIIDCSSGDVFYVRGKGGNSDRLYCWIDSENKVISSALSNQNQQTPLKIVAPTNAVKLIINDEESGRVSYKGDRTCDKETYRQIKLVAFAASQSELNVGDIYYNTNERQIRCVTSQPSGYYIIPYYDGAIYTYNNIIYTWNGDTLVPVAKVSGNKLVLGGTHFGGIETDFVNINNLTNSPDAFPTRIDAYTAIPNAFRTLGMTVAYLLHYSSANVDKWEIEQYNGTSIDTSSWKDSSNWVKLNKGIEIVNNLTSGGTDKALSAEMGKVLSANLGGLEDKVEKTVYEEPIDINNSILKEGWYIDSNNVWRNSEPTYSCILVPIPQNGGFLRLVSGLLDCVYAFLAATYSYNYSRPSYAANTSRMTLAPNSSVEVKIPVDAQYLYLYKRGSSGSYLPVSVTRIVYPDMVIANLDKHITDIVNSVLSSNVQRSITSTGRDIPRNVGINNMYKKAHQMMDIPWTSLYNLPRVANSSIKVNAGDYLGFPYSSVKEKDKFVGFDVSYRTFMTAAHNPYSLLYTEDTFDGVRNDGTGAVGGISQYGFTYHGVNCGPYFGVVCNVFALLPLGFDIPWNTAEFDYLEYIGVLDKIEDQSASGVQVGDIIWETGHGNLITDIIRDSRGIPTQIYWSESSAMDDNKLIRTNIYTAAEFNQRLAMGNPTEQQSVGGIIYRIPEAYKNLSYTPSPFVAVEGEPTPSEWEYNDDICTFAGDYACFFEGDIIFLNYTKGNYTSLEIYKNDTLLSTKSLSASADVHKIDLTSDNLTYGKYKARLTDGSNHSDYTYWEIVDCNVTYANVSGDLKHITFDSHNGHPLYIAFVYQSGACRGMYKLTDADIKNGYVEICPRELLNDQYMRGSSSPALYQENVYVKVFFKGDYGTVRNEPILTDLYNG